MMNKDLTGEATQPASDETPPPPFSSRIYVNLFGMTDKGYVRAKNEDHFLIVRHNDDQILLCTDGLTDMVDENEIEIVLNSAISAKSACRSLIDLALNNGGRDNVTVIVARYSIPPQ